MAISHGTAVVPGTARDHAFHALTVRDIVTETGDARSFVFDTGGDLAALYGYQPGQFLTFRAVIDGEAHLRCYSMSSSPSVDRHLAVTVKRVPDGVVSNWMIDTLGPGAVIEATLPSGIFGRRSGGGDVVAFAGGSGITPVLSILKSVLATGSSSARLFYANRDAGSVIFDGELASLADGYPGRLEVVHHLDEAVGLVTPEEVLPLAPGRADTDYYVCGPAPFMDLVETTLHGCGVSPAAVHLERFDPPAEAVPVAPPAAETRPTSVTIELNGRTDVARYRPGTTILQTARQLGMAPPFSCEAGSCATCMARLLEGKVEMYTNNALTDDELAEGWILTCQSVPTTPSVHVLYGYE